MKCPYCKSENTIDADGNCTCCAQNVPLALVTVIPPAQPVLPVGVTPKNAHERD